MATRTQHLYHRVVGDSPEEILQVVSALCSFYGLTSYQQLNVCCAPRYGLGMPEAPHTGLLWTHYELPRTPVLRALPIHMEWQQEGAPQIPVDIERFLPYLLTLALEPAVLEADAIWVFSDTQPPYRYPHFRHTGPFLLERPRWRGPVRLS